MSRTIALVLLTFRRIGVRRALLPLSRSRLLFASRVVPLKRNMEEASLVRGSFGPLPDLRFYFSTCFFVNYWCGGRSCCDVASATIPMCVPSLGAP